MKLSKTARKILRQMDITSKDVHKTGSNCCGVVYGLYNPYYLTEITFYGTVDRNHIYHKLLERLWEQMRIDTDLVPLYG